jgi:hypothetical protein
MDGDIAFRVSQGVDQRQIKSARRGLNRVADYFGSGLARSNHCCVFADHAQATANLVFGFATAVGQIQNDGFAIAFFAVIFIEDRLRYDILFAGPISQVTLAASFAAKWKIRMNRGIGGGFTYRAFVFHIVLPGL